MTTIEMMDLVRRWFGHAGQADGPLLPDGWFGGRCRENTFWLKDVRASDEALDIHFDSNTVLHFDRPGRAFVENSELVFDGFQQATLRWRHYGGGPDAPYHEKRYTAGQVRLVPPVGTTVLL